MLSFAAAVSAAAIGTRQTSCSFEQRQAGVQQEITTIRSHTAADADAIPLAPLASRTFFITPAELGGTITLSPVNVGMTADTVRAELVALATILNAGVPQGSDTYTDNANGSVTVDFIQPKTDQIVLESVQVREIHEFDLSTCQITQIVGYVRGNVVCPSSDADTVLNNTVVEQICTELLSANPSSKAQSSQ